ncbi:MAG TPA: AAA family ATPase [Solirubrobacteraceae bacterium]|nr:AAA family ATPase [Solirubrobacteraceae bacterium]
MVALDLGQRLHDLPASLRITSPFPFIGRSAELEKLTTLVPRAEGESRRMILLGGEPGSGKSRLIREFAARAAAEGALVLYGACDAVVRTPYGPFAQALRRLARVIDPAELRTAVGAGGGELTRLLPELPGVIGELPAPTRADPDTERHRLHTAVTDLLDGISQRFPVVLVIEDGHWGDASTFLLLRHLAHSPWMGRVLLLATFRDGEADVPEPLSNTLADLRRADDVLRLSVSGLSEEEVGEFVRRAADGAQLPDVARTISELTGGNPFLVCELWRALRETGVIELGEGPARVALPLTSLGAPKSVREVVGQRLARLAPTTTELLELAATAGAHFELDLMRQGLGRSERELVSALDDALRSGIIEELSRPRLAYRFTHELVRRAVYDGLTGVRRAELHLRVGEALEAAGRSRQMLPDLAHHFAAAAPFGDVTRAIDYNVSAARAASGALAFDEAADLLRAALELGIEDETRRAEVLLELGTALHRAGKAFDARDAFASVAEIARELQDAELLARAATGYEESSWRPGASGQAAALLEEAVAALGERSTTERVGLLSGLARSLDSQGRHQNAIAVRAEAAALARRLGDRAGLAAILVRSYWSRGAIPVEEILGMLGEAKAIGEELGDTEIQAEALSWIVPALVAVADIASARMNIKLLRELAEITAQPFYVHVAEHYGAAIALCDGHLQAAEAMSLRSEAAGRLLTGRDASGTYGIQMFSLRRAQGRLAELAPMIRVLSAAERVHGPWRPGLVSVLVELGMLAEARRELDRISSEGLDGMRETLWLASLTYLVDACAALGDERLAALLYPELLPLAGENVMIGHLVVCYGAADRYLGMLAGVLGEWERAEAHFESACELNRQMGARTWLAETEYQFARMLLRADRPSGGRAPELLSHAAELASVIGMSALSGRISAIGAPIRRAEMPDRLSFREAQILRLVAQGLSNREIGQSLFISEHTAANHIRSILRKTGCANRTEAASYAHRHSLAGTGGAG